MLAVGGSDELASADHHSHCVALVIVSGLFPPYKARHSRGRTTQEEYMGYFFLVHGPSDAAAARRLDCEPDASLSYGPFYYFSTHIMTSRLFTQVALIVIVTFGLVLATGSKPRKVDKGAGQ